MKEIKVASWISVLSTLALLASVGGLGYWQWRGLVSDFNRPGYELTLKKSTRVSAEEKMEIDLWIKESDLNKYGDPKGTVYPGGNPLFDEKTGQLMDRYDYILKNHPDRPWRK